MAHKNTVAIIGATTAVGTLVAKSIAADYRLLLMDNDEAQLALLQDGIQAADKTAAVEVHHCCMNASWEADFIVVANDGEGLNEMAVKMKDVSNCKTVLHFTAHQTMIDRLQQLLPHAKVVSILWSQPFTDASTDAFIRGMDKEAVDTAKSVVAAMAYQPHIHQGDIIT